MDREERKQSEEGRDRRANALRVAGSAEETWRTELRLQLDAAQAEIDLAIDELRRSGADSGALAEATAQSQRLVQLQRLVSDATTNRASDLKAAVGAVVATATVIATRSHEVAASAKSGDAASLAQATEAARREVEALSRDMYERKIFDPYLRFTSSEDEAEYRRREAENRRYIDAELAKGTPEGALNASGGMQDQMLDAAANGADQSPEFKERWKALRRTAREQREALRAEGKSTEEYDRRVEDSVRRFLRSKGLTEAEIDEKIKAAGDDPLAAAEPYLEGEKDARALDKEVDQANARSRDPSPTAEYDDAPVEAARSGGSEDVFAQFQNTGVRFTGEGSGHGLKGGKPRDRDGPPTPA